MTGDGDRLDEAQLDAMEAGVETGAFVLSPRTALTLIRELRDARAENERLRLNSDAAAVAMTRPLYSAVESTAQQLHELGEHKAAKQIRMVLAQVRVAQGVAAEFDQMAAELAAERAKVAEAWHEGYQDGWSDRAHPANEDRARNPYRAAAQPGGEDR